MLAYALSCSFAANLSDTDILPKINLSGNRQSSAHKGTNRLVSWSVNIDYERVFHSDFSLDTFWIRENTLNCPTHGHFLMSRLKTLMVYFKIFCGKWVMNKWALYIKYINTEFVSNSCSISKYFFAFRCITTLYIQTFYFCIYAIVRLWISV